MSAGTDLDAPRLARAGLMARLARACFAGRLALAGTGLLTLGCYSGSPLASGDDEGTTSGATDGSSSSSSTSSTSSASASTGDGSTSEGSASASGSSGDATDGDTEDPLGDTTGPQGEDPLAELDRYTPEEARDYLRAIAPMVVGRLMSPAEEALIEHFQARGIVPVLEGWVEEESFAETARMMMQIKLAASGQGDEIDFELPGNLAAHLARKGLPYRELITSDTCIDGGGNAIPCDTGAPYTAGVLTTRAYLRANASRFNLRRARRMMYIFNCLTYPMDTELQPPLEKSLLIPMFRALTPDEQTVPEAKNGFGNGFACYNCHSQFGAHAQLFVRFDETGLYHADATGLQDPENELGRSQNGLFVSHFVSPVAAPKELSQVFGTLVSTVRDAAEVLADDPTFYECASRNVIEWTFGLGEAEGAMTDRALLVETAARALDRSPEPSFGDLFVATLTHPDVIDVVLDNPATQGDAP
ncbi:MAG: hypothetical protein R3B09_23490 [Nannocystaceae bacterium]